MAISINWKKNEENRAKATYFGKRIGIIGRLFGCFHGQLSRPFTRENVSYRSCLDCGARKKFDAENLVTYGSYYYPPAIEGNH